MLAFMEFDDGLDDDPSSYRTPPPPDDRLWRHPSEMRPKRASSGERVWLVASISGLVGALLASGVVIVAGGLNGRTTEHVIERQDVPVQTVASTPKADSVVDIAQRVRPAITQIQV